MIMTIWGSIYQATCNGRSGGLCSTKFFTFFFQWLKQHIFFVCKLNHSLDQLSKCNCHHRLDIEAAQFKSIYFTSDSVHEAKVAASSLCKLVSRVVSGSLDNGFAVIRPPGHHAEPSLAGGYCVINNVAVAAAYAQAKLGTKRVLIVDWDSELTWSDSTHTPCPNPLPSLSSTSSSRKWNTEVFFWQPECIVFLCPSVSWRQLLSVLARWRSYKSWKWTWRRLQHQRWVEREKNRWWRIPCSLGKTSHAHCDRIRSGSCSRQCRLWCGSRWHGGMWCLPRVLRSANTQTEDVGQRKACMCSRRWLCQKCLM